MKSQIVLRIDSYPYLIPKLHKHHVLIWCGVSDDLHTFNEFSEEKRGSQWRTNQQLRNFQHATYMLASEFYMSYWPGNILLVLMCFGIAGFIFEPVNEIKCQIITKFQKK